MRVCFEMNCPMKGTAVLTGPCPRCEPPSITTNHTSAERAEQEMKALNRRLAGKRDPLGGGDTS